MHWAKKNMDKLRVALNALIGGIGVEECCA